MPVDWLIERNDEVDAILEAQSGKYYRWVGIRRYDEINSDALDLIPGIENPYEICSGVGQMDVRKQEGFVGCPDDGGAVVCPLITKTCSGSGDSESYGIAFEDGLRRRLLQDLDG